MPELSSVLPKLEHLVELSFMDFKINDIKPLHMGSGRDAQELPLPNLLPEIPLHRVHTKNRQFSNVGYQFYEMLQGS